MLTVDAVKVGGKAALNAALAKYRKHFGDRTRVDVEDDLEPDDDRD